MGYEEFVVSALARGKPYEQLPSTLHSIITIEEYHQKVKEFWIGRGAEWSKCPAQTVCNESEYYDSLVKAYKAWMRVSYASVSTCTTQTHWPQCLGYEHKTDGIHRLP